MLSFLLFLFSSLCLIFLCVVMLYMILDLCNPNPYISPWEYMLQCFGKEDTL